MRCFLFAYFLSVNFTCFSQLDFAEEYHSNGKIKFKGKYMKCLTRDIPKFTDIYEKRKTGKWVYYYYSGNVKRIEHYTKVKSCNKPTYKEKKWQYFNEEGKLFLEEKYLKDELVYKEIEIYNGELLSSKIIFTRNNQDTIIINLPSHSQNIIPNSKFEKYYYKPINITNNGQNNIEEVIPDWVSPDHATPDYYNSYRKIKGVSANLNKDVKPINGNGYIGLMTFLDPNNRYESWDYRARGTYDQSYIYSETIQSRLHQKLEKGKVYCFKMDIILSQNAGYGIDRFGIYLSDTAVQFKPDKFPKNPQLTFHFPMLETQKWIPLCSWLKANGNEKYITLGRFSLPNETMLFPTDPHISTELDISKSAYYLIDNIELFEVATPQECICSKTDPINEESTVEEKLKEVENFEKRERNKFVLTNVNFDFDKFEIKQSSINELLKLKSFLISNPKIKILITGHTDNLGSKTYNQNLSYKRALAIKKWLVNHGIQSKRILCQGKGFDIPVIDNQTDQNKTINRRVEFEIINN